MITTASPEPRSASHKRGGLVWEPDPEVLLWSPPPRGTRRPCPLPRLTPAEQWFWTYGADETVVEVLTEVHCYVGSLDERTGRFDGEDEGVAVFDARGRLHASQGKSPAPEASPEPDAPTEGPEDAPGEDDDYASLGDWGSDDHTPELTEVHRFDGGYRRAPAPALVPTYFAGFMVALFSGTGRAPDAEYSRRADIERQLREYADARRRRLEAARRPVASIPPRRGVMIPGVIHAQGRKPTTRPANGEGPYRQERQQHVLNERYGAVRDNARPRHRKVDLRREGDPTRPPRRGKWMPPILQQGRYVRKALSAYRTFCDLTVDFERKRDSEGGHGLQERQPAECLQTATNLCTERGITLAELQAPTVKRIGRIDRLLTHRRAIAIDLRLQGFCTEDITHATGQAARTVRRWTQDVAPRDLEDHAERDHWHRPGWSGALAEIASARGALDRGEPASPPPSWWGPDAKPLQTPNGQSAPYR